MPPSPPHATPELRTYRVACLLTAVLVPLFGYVYHAHDPDVVDPLWVRWGLGTLPLAVAVGTYLSPWVRTHLDRLGPALIYVFVSWFGILTVLNDLAAEYALGYLLVVVMIGLAMPDTSPLPTTLGCLLYAVVVAAGAFALQAPGMNPGVFWFCVATTGVSIFVGIWLRVEMRARMEASEVRYRTVFDNATDGLFLSDVETLRFLHANEAYLALTGYTLDELRALTLHDVVVAPPDLIEEKARELRDQRHVTIGEQRHRHKDGTPLDLEIGVACIEEGSRLVFCTTAHDLREQKRARAEIEAARTRAEEMLRLKTALLHNMSHELRTPLVGILGFAEVLADEVTGEQREMVEALSRNARRLSDTLHALLDLAHLKSGEATLMPEVVDVADEAEAAAELFVAEAEAKGLSCCVETAGTARAQLDRDALRRVLTHLLSNAVKFTAEGGVALRVEADAQRVFLCVCDTGIGIADRDLPALFAEFEQGSMGMRRSHEGSGLGLAITRQLVDLMGGRIEVQSASGEGTTVTVSFARTWASTDARLEAPAAPADGAVSRALARRVVRGSPL